MLFQDTQYYGSSYGYGSYQSSSSQYQPVSVGFQGQPQYPQAGNTAVSVSQAYIPSSGFQQVQQPAQPTSQQPASVPLPQPSSQQVDQQHPEYYSSISSQVCGGTTGAVAATALISSQHPVAIPQSQVLTSQGVIIGSPPVAMGSQPLTVISHPVVMASLPMVVPSVPSVAAAMSQPSAVSGGVVMSQPTAVVMPQASAGVIGGQPAGVSHAPVLAPPPNIMPPQQTPLMSQPQNTLITSQPTMIPTQPTLIASQTPVLHPQTQVIIPGRSSAPTVVGSETHCVIPSSVVGQPPAAVTQPPPVVAQPIIPLQTVASQQHTIIPPVASGQNMLNLSSVPQVLPSVTSQTGLIPAHVPVPSATTLCSHIPVTIISETNSIMSADASVSIDGVLHRPCTSASELAATTAQVISTLSLIQSQQTVSLTQKEASIQNSGGLPIQQGIVSTQPAVLQCQPSVVPSLPGVVSSVTPLGTSQSTSAVASDASQVQFRVRPPHLIIPYNSNFMFSASSHAAHVETHLTPQTLQTIAPYSKPPFQNQALVPSQLSKSGILPPFLPHRNTLPSVFFPPEFSAAMMRGVAPNLGEAMSEPHHHLFERATDSVSFAQLLENSTAAMAFGENNPSLHAILKCYCYYSKRGNMLSFSGAVSIYLFIYLFFFFS